MDLHACGNSVVQSILACNFSCGQEVSEKIQIKIFFNDWKLTLKTSDPRMAAPLCSYMLENPRSIIPISLALWSLNVAKGGTGVHPSLNDEVNKLAENLVRPTKTGSLDRLSTLMS